MDKFNSHINKILDGKDVNHDLVIDYLNNLGNEKIFGELEKTTREKKLIDFSQECLNDYLKSFKKDIIYNISEEKIHIVPPGGVENVTGGRSRLGVSSSKLGACIVDRNLNDIDFSIILFHEMYHLKDFTSIKIDKNQSLQERRNGISIKVNNENYFDLINEVINDYFCKKFFEEKIKNSDLFNKEDLKKYEIKLPRQKLIDSFENNLEDLFYENKDKFNSKEEIRSLFIDADINGRLLPVARLLEKTYGNGFFRKLGRFYRT